MSETAAVVTALHENRLPAEFWNLDAFNEREHLRDIHAMVVERLQNEAPDADTLELMLMERVSFLYIFMRAREAADEEPNFDRTYKEMMALWVSMAADLRKQRLRAEETSSIRMMIVSEVSKALKEALKDVDPVIANSVQTKLITLVAV